MTSQHSFKVLIVLASGIAILACNLTRSSATSASPTVEAGPATSTGGGIPVSASPIGLIIPDGLAASASAETIDVVTDQTGAPWDIAPAHLQLTFQGYALQTSFHVPQLFVYPAPSYAAANSSAAESLKRLQAILANPGAKYANDALPYVPFFNAGQVFAAQEKVLQFHGGSGLRILTQYAQDVEPINNSGLFYHFEGLSSDGKYYIVGILPTNLPFLAADNNPNSPVPSGGLAFPPNTASSSSFDYYFTHIAGMVDSASPDQFSPSVNMLDALIQSISVP